MKFTDEDGREWEDITNRDTHTMDTRVIRPVRQELKRYSINLFVLDEEPVDAEPPLRISKLHYEVATKDQAQLIKQSVELLMEYIDGGNVLAINLFDKARHSMRENN